MPDLKIVEIETFDAPVLYPSPRVVMTWIIVAALSMLSADLIL